MDNDVPRHRPLAFDKMESLIKEMQDPETGVPVRSQKLFLSVIPSAFMGYDLVEWLMDRFNLDETSNVEAINLANQLCQYGYFFPVNDLKNLVLKDDSSLYRFQSPYYWPWQTARVAGSGSASGAAPLAPDNVEYAIYLVKRTLRNKQRHALEEYEQEALANLKKNLAAKWDFITMQAEEQVRLAKDRKKGDKIVSDSQERAFWRVARPPPGVPSALEQCPVPVRARARNKRRTIQQLQREIEILKASLDRTRVKTSIALEALVGYSETFAPYDPWLTPPQPSNPWISDDTLFWQINSPLVDVPSEKRVQRWALSIEELVSDPTGLQEFTSFLRKEYSHENIRFWLAVMDLRRSSTKEIPRKLEDIYEEFLKPGAPCEINIDGATQEKVAEGLRSGSRYALDHAADHVYGLLLKKDCYPRFVRSDHFQRLLTEGKNVHQKKAKFFNFGGQVKKKPGGSAGGGGGAGGAGAGLGRRRGSDRSLSGSAHELAVCAAQPPREPAHSHSQSNLAEMPFRDPLDDGGDEALPWETYPREGGARRRQDSAADSGSSSSDVSACVAAAGGAGAGALPAERRRLPQQSTLDGGLRGAPPPLRRLSAVEPRHLAPLASPPHSPRAPRPAPPAPAPAPAPAPHAPHPTPTISVSSAPDDDSPEERALAPEEPPSVFATPTDPAKPLAAAADPAATPVGEDTLRTDASAEAPPGAEADPHRPPSREPSTIKEISPALSRDSSGIGELPVSAAETAPASEKSPPRGAGPRAASAPPSRAASGDPPPPAPAARPAGEGTPAPPTPALMEVPKPTIAATVERPEETAASTPPERAEPAAAGRGSPGAGAAPLAQLEELAGDADADDDDADKVPSAPPPPPAPDAAPAPAPPPPPPDAAKPIAHRDELSSVSQSNNVKRDNKSESGERAPRNDVCPWEDENSCESDAPFVKTYATLGYL